MFYTLRSHIRLKIVLCPFAKEMNRKVIQQSSKNDTYDVVMGNMNFGVG